MSSKYKVTIGIECHVQLDTKTKLFAAVANDAREAAPNTLVSHICFGMPGALPVLNQKVLAYAARMAFAFNTEPQKHSYFERKHYFYPDLPKGYQITQLDAPIIKGGEVHIEVDGKQRTIPLDRVQIEEDAGKNTHPSGANYSLVDLNRAGTPLFEIVSQPAIHSAAEAKAYARELYLLVRYAAVSNADLYHGNMRFDVNVSLSSDDSLGTRTETKNLNSFRSVEKAAEYEIARQTALLDRGEKIVQETRGWDDVKQITISQRGKEEAHDYRYFPDPDIPPIELSDEAIEHARKALPIMPGQWRKMLADMQLDASHIETLLDAELESTASYLSILKTHADDKSKAKAIANLLVNVEIPQHKEDNSKIKLQDDAQRTHLYNLVYELQNQNKLSSTNAKSLLLQVLALDQCPDDVSAFASEKGLLQMSDESELESIVEQVVAENQSAADDVRRGEMKAIGFLVGQVMKASKGKANPKIVQSLLRDKLVE